MMRKREGIFFLRFFPVCFLVFKYFPVPGGGAAGCQRAAAAGHGDVAYARTPTKTTFELPRMPITTSMG